MPVSPHVLAGRFIQLVLEILFHQIADDSFTNLERIVRRVPRVCQSVMKKNDVPCLPAAFGGFLLLEQIVVFIVSVRFVSSILSQVLIIENSVALGPDGEPAAVCGHVIYKSEHAQMKFMSVGMGFERLHGNITLGKSAIDATGTSWHRKTSFT